MLKKSTMNVKISRPVVASKIEKPIKTEKSLKKHDETKEKSNRETVASSGKTVAVTKKMSSGQEATAIAKPRTNLKPSLTKSKPSTLIAGPIKPKISNGATNKITRNQPIKAIHQAQTKKPVAEKNVMNTIHNVTVASPPPVRKDFVAPKVAPQEIVESLPRERTKTRTLDPEEVLILKKSKIDENTPVPPGSSTTQIKQKKMVIQDPVAFEITFDKATTSEKTEAKSKQTQDISDGDYEDDFDSYESDFETDSSISSQSASISSNSATNSTDSSAPTESRKVFSPTKKLDDERDFDSGTYDFKGATDKIQLDSIDEREPHSEGQNDSGFGQTATLGFCTSKKWVIPSSATLHIMEFQEILFKILGNNVADCGITHMSSEDNYVKKIAGKSTYSKRGMDLMKKINLDTMTFTLFELKPLSYDLYMRIYGHKNTNQCSTQTVGNMIDQDVQTDQKTKQSMWTQFPPAFVANVILNENSYPDRVGCGEGVEDVCKDSNECVFEKKLKLINKMNVTRDVWSIKPIDYERLNFFLQKSEITISSICDTNFVISDLHKSDFSLSEGFFEIPTNASKILNETTIYYMYSNPKIHNFVYLAHRHKPTSGNDNSFVTVWNVTDTKKLIHTLSCWSLIICLEVHHHFQDVVIGGLSDGCIAIWNLTESTFWHQHIDDQTILVPTQIISPCVNTKSIDLGCVISLKSIYPINQIHEDDFRLTQICSLHEFGMLTIWNILKTNPHFTHTESYSEIKIDHRSPWSKVQLIQSNIADLASTNLTKKTRPKSGFEKKKMYFESNLFSDAALRELHDLDGQKDLLNQSDSFRCVDMEYHEDGIIVATNKSYLIFIATSLSRDSLRKLLIDKSNFLHATKLKSMKDALLVGLSDGTVKVIRVRNSNVLHKHNDRDSCRPGVHLEENNFSAKSCAIQNIIKEERQFLDDDMSNERFKRVGKGIDASITTVVPGNRVINNQVLLPAMSLNRDFVRWMDVSVNLNCMMGLCGEYLRILNFQNFVEIQGGDSHSGFSFAAIVFGYNNREYLVSVEGDNVRVYLLRKNML